MCVCVCSQYRNNINLLTDLPTLTDSLMKIFKHSTLCACPTTTTTTTKPKVDINLITFCLSCHTQLSNCVDKFVCVGKKNCASSLRKMQIQFVVVVVAIVWAVICDTFIYKTQKKSLGWALKNFPICRSRRELRRGLFFNCHAFALTSFHRHNIQIGSDRFILVGIILDLSILHSLDLTLSSVKNAQTKYAM